MNQQSLTQTNLFVFLFCYCYSFVLFFCYKLTLASVMFLALVECPKYTNYQRWFCWNSWFAFFVFLFFVFVWAHSCLSLQKFGHYFFVCFVVKPTHTKHNSSKTWNHKLTLFWCIMSKNCVLTKKESTHTKKLLLLFSIVFCMFFADFCVWMCKVIVGEIPFCVLFLILVGPFNFDFSFFWGVWFLQEISVWNWIFMLYFNGNSKNQL